MAKFKLLGEGKDKVPVYQGKSVEPGGIVEFTGIFEEKARKNPSFEEVKEK